MTEKYRLSRPFERMGNDGDLGRYVLVVVGVVEAATIEAKLDNVKYTAKDVLRRQPDLPGESVPVGGGLYDSLSRAKTS